jgi:hypothetical protein
MSSFQGGKCHHLKGGNVIISRGEMPSFQGENVIISRVNVIQKGGKCHHFLRNNLSPKAELSMARDVHKACKDETRNKTLYKERC